MVIPNTVALLMIQGSSLPDLTCCAPASGVNLSTKVTQENKSTTVVSSRGLLPWKRQGQKLLRSLFGRCKTDLRLQSGFNPGLGRILQ